MKKLCIIICFLLALLFVSCNNSSDNAENDSSKIKVTFDYNDGSEKVKYQYVEKDETI